MTMRVPHQLANKAMPQAELPALEGIDIESVREAAVAHGADAGLFAAFLAAGADAAGSAGSVSPIDLVGVAAWRAGALALRDDALARVSRLSSGDKGAVAAALLGIGEDDVATFVDRQRTDRWWWPGRDDARGYVAAVGGFVGMGGAWTEPPRRGVTLAEDGGFAILAGSSWWRLDADVWCSRLVQVSDPPDEWLDVVTRKGDDGDAASVRVLASGAWSATVTVSLVKPPQTHLAWLYAETA